MSYNRKRIPSRLRPIEEIDKTNHKSTKKISKRKTLRKTILKSVSDMRLIWGS